jgi:dihydropteroate synthase
LGRGTTPERYFRHYCDAVIPDVMGIVNVTPDSFSDGGRYLRVDDAIAHGLQLAAEGAAVLDVGGESTRPGAEPVDVDTELARVVPVIEGLRAATAGSVRLSVDTRHAAVARAAVAAGASLINDVSASLHEVAAELGVGWVAMHMRGEPRTMQQHPHYDDVVAEVCAELSRAARAGEQAGVREVWVDPGIGFGKSAEHNWTLLAQLDRVVALGWPVLVGASRKGFLGAALAKSDGSDGSVPVDDRREASIAVATWAMLHGARMVRAHEVRATAHAARVVAA